VLFFYAELALRLKICFLTSSWPFPSPPLYFESITQAAAQASVGPGDFLPAHHGDFLARAGGAKSTYCTDRLEAVPLPLALRQYNLSVSPSGVPSIGSEYTKAIMKRLIEARAGREAGARRMPRYHRHRPTLRDTRQQGPHTGLIPGDRWVPWSWPNWRSNPWPSVRGLAPPACTKVAQAEGERKISQCSMGSALLYERNRSGNRSS
jgi:hypothetical protein